MRKRMFRLMILLIASCMNGLICAAQSGERMPFQTPAVSRTQIAFVYAGSVWIVDRQGGEARRLTTQPGAEHTAVFSPDGSQLALTRNVGGNLDVYIVPAARRLTTSLKVSSGSRSLTTPSAKAMTFLFRKTSCSARA